LRVVGELFSVLPKKIKIRSGFWKLWKML